MRTPPAVAGVPQETSGNFKLVKDHGKAHGNLPVCCEFPGDSQTYGETRGDSPVISETSSDSQDLGETPKNPQVRHETQKDSLVCGDASVLVYIPGDFQSRGKSQGDS